VEHRPVKDQQVANGKINYFPQDMHLDMTEDNDELTQESRRRLRCIVQNLFSYLLAQLTIAQIAARFNTCAMMNTMSLIMPA
jgi:hypothetical protein